MGNLFDDGFQPNRERHAVRLALQRGLRPGLSQDEARELARMRTLIPGVERNASDASPMSTKLNEAIGESEATATLPLDERTQAGPAEVAPCSAAPMPVTPWTCLEAAAVYIERYPLFIVAILAALYLYRIGRPIQKVFWFDELFTYYIAQSRGSAVSRRSA